MNLTAKKDNLLQYILVTIALSLIIQSIISFKMWVSIDRTFPLVHAVGWFHIQWVKHLQLLFFILMLFTLIVMIVPKYRKIAVYIFIQLAVLFIVEDITRFQPWIYLYGLILLLITFAGINQKENTQIKLAIISLLAATYCWSGIQKLNIAFSQEIFPWLMTIFQQDTFFKENSGLAYIAAAAEIITGLALLFKRSRIVAVSIGMLIHLSILICIGPWALNWNMVIWPWNISMIVILLLIAVDNSSIPQFSSDTFLYFKKHPFFLIVFILSWIFPVLNYVGLWDSHLSGSLYSGNNSEAIFYYEENDKKGIAGAEAYTFFYPGTKEEFIMLDQWCIGDLEAPFYPEERYFVRLGKKLCDCVQNKEDAGIKIAVKKKFSSQESLKIYTCAEIEQKERK